MNESPARKTRVLLVDDDRVARISLRTVLLKLNFDVTEAARADEALAILDGNLGEFAVAVLDIKLAGTSGLDLLKEIKQRDPLIEAVMVTGFETVEAAKRALRLGACDFVNKPFDIPALSGAVLRALKLHETSKVAQQRDADLKHMLDEMGDQGIEWVRIQRGIVHDVRNMLCTVRSYHHHVDAILGQRRQLDAVETETMKKHMELIGRQLATIVAVLDRQANLWGGEKAADANVAAVLDDLVMLVQRHPDAKRTDIDLRLESQNLRALCSASDLAEIFLNLLLNASQSSTHGVRIAIEGRRETTPVDNIESPNGYANVRTLVATPMPPGAQVIRLKVRDNGMGIPHEVLTRLGKEQITTKGARGTGLGIGVVTETVTRRGGQIVLRSTLHHGTEVELLLPCAPQPASEVAPTLSG